MATVDSCPIALDDEGCSAELTEEDKVLILRLVSLEYSGDKSEFSEYKCKQKCTVCSENKPHFLVDDSLLNKLLLERKVFLSLEDRKAINKDLVHEYFKKKWEVSNQKMKTLQPETETTKTDGDLSKCSKRNTTSAIFSNEKEASSILHDNPKLSDYKQMSYEVETTTVKKPNTEMEQIENEYIKMNIQEEVSKLEVKSAQIHCDQSTREKSHIGTKLEGTRTKNTKDQGQLIFSTRKKEEKECKNKPKITTKNDKHDERAERLKRMKASLDMALNTWNRSKSKGSHTSTTTENKSHENVNKIKGDVDDKRDGYMIELHAETSRMETQAPIEKEIQAETSRRVTKAPSKRELPAETPRRETQAPSKSELQAETSRREIQAPSKRDLQAETSRRETQAPSKRELQAETSRMETQAPIEKEIQAEASIRVTQAPSKRDLQAETSRRATQAPSKRELQAETSRMETQAPIKKEILAETSRRVAQAPSKRELPAETLRRETQAPSKRELQAETSRRETQAQSEKSKDKNYQEPTDTTSTALFNGKPMDDPKGKYYIDRESVDVPMYQEGLKYDKWNPTQCLYEITSKCGWTWPLFTVTRVDKTSLIPSYVCEAVINGENFQTDEGVAQKKFAQHMASTKILKYIGFDFEYHCTRI